MSFAFFDLKRQYASLQGDLEAAVGRVLQSQALMAAEIEEVAGAARGLGAF